MTIVESIKCVLQQNNDGLTSKQIYDEIIRQGLYSFGAEKKQLLLLLLPKLQIFLNCYRKKKSKLRCRSIYKIYDNKYLILS